MAKLIYTDEGITLMADLVAGKDNVIFSKVKTSDMFNMGNVKQSFDVEKVKKISSNQVIVSATLNNVELQEGYYIRSVGLYVTNKKNEEILYAYTNIKDNPDYMPEISDNTVTKINYKFDTMVNNSDRVQLEIVGGNGVTMNEFQETTDELKNQDVIIEKKIEDLKSELKYEKAKGTGTDIQLTLPENIEDGYIKYFIASEDNNKAATNINDIPLYEPNSTNAPKLKAGEPYQLYYDTDHFFIRSGKSDLSFVTATSDKIWKGYSSVDKEGNKIDGTFNLNFITATSDKILSGYYGSDINGNRITGTRKLGNLSIYSTTVNLNFTGRADSYIMRTKTNSKDETVRYINYMGSIFNCTGFSNYTKIIGVEHKGVLSAFFSNGKYLITEKLGQCESFLVSYPVVLLDTWNGTGSRYDNFKTYENQQVSNVIIYYIKD